MPGTYAKILLHVVFSTKGRAQMIKEPVQDRLYAYLGGIVRDERGVLMQAGGVADHVHLLVRWRTDGTVADLLRNVKGRSSKWAHETFAEMHSFAWQAGYGAFSVSESQVENVANYIRTQAEHHRSRTFQQEFVGLLELHGVEYDERYLWD